VVIQILVEAGPYILAAGLAYVVVAPLNPVVDQAGYPAAGHQAYQGEVSIHHLLRLVEVYALDPAR
jgi:hypothetical protein